jgi:hypothetical protein
MKLAHLALAWSWLVLCGCDASRPAASTTRLNDGGDNSNSAVGPWHDGHGDPVDPNDNVYSEVDHFTLVATTVGAGTVQPSAGTYENGTAVTLTALPDAGWAFDHWDGDASGTAPVTTVTVVADTVVVAWFISLPPLIDNDNVSDNTNTNDNGSENQNDNGDDDETIVVEPGSSFASAPLVDLGPDGSIILEQTLAQASDVHVYDFGALVLGDRFIATCAAAAGSTLDPMIALFDADGYRVFWNDDVDLAHGDYDANLNDLVRHDSAHHFLAVTSTDYTETSGAYRLTIEVQRQAGIPQLASQTILIDLDGATQVTVSGMNWGDFAAFDAAALNAAFEGQTEALKAVILAVVQADYAPYHVTVLSTDNPPPANPFTTVFLGGDSDALFGIADQIDFYNADRQDNVVVFAGAFAGLSGSLEAVGQAIGNVVSHEVGHVLGLMHTTDVTELMDTTGAADTLLVDQHFGIATVFDFPIGFQNAPLLLEETLGLTARPRVIVEDGYLRCGTCGAKLYKVSPPTVRR